MQNLRKEMCDLVLANKSEELKKVLHDPSKIQNYQVLLQAGWAIDHNAAKNKTANILFGDEGPAYLAIYNATRKGELECLKILFKFYKNQKLFLPPILRPSVPYPSFLHIAARSYKIRIPSAFTYIMLEYPDQIVMTYEGHTPLFDLIRNCEIFHWGVFEEAIQTISDEKNELKFSVAQKEAIVKQQNLSGWTLLHYIIVTTDLSLGKKEALIKLLAKLGPLPINTPNKDEETPLDFVMKKNLSDCKFLIKLLIQNDTANSLWIPNKTDLLLI